MLRLRANAPNTLGYARGNRVSGQDLFKDKSGSMALWATLMLAVAVLITGGVVDYISLSLQSKDVQRAADKAALAAAHELVLASDSKSRVQEVASAFVAANYSRDATTEASIIENGAAVLVKLAVAPRVFFPGPIGMGAKAVKAEAVAEVAGDNANVCVIALDVDSDRAISLEKNSKLDAPNCAIYSNSKRSKGLSSLENGKLIGNLICSAGGREGSTSNYSPQPVTDCPQIADPLAERARPQVGACTFNKFKKKDFTGTLTPGVYCDGLELMGASKVTLQPGVYVIKDGDFKVGDTAQMTGEGVGFFMTGKNGRFEFTKQAKVRLSAPKTGTMAGLLFMEDNTILEETKHRITSDFADYLVGTIYLPRGSFMIDATQDVASASEFTVLVVRSLELKEAPHLVLNTNYGATSVPVPEGLGNRAVDIRLAR